MAKIDKENIKILVVDDDETARSLTNMTLDKNGYKNIYLTEDGEKGWKALIGDPTIDLIILDWKLPELSGLGFLNRLHKDDKLRNLPVLIVSAYLDKHDFALLGELHLSGKMEKPTNPILLTKKIHDLLAESEWFKENLKKIDAEEEDFDKKFEFVKSCPRPLPLAISFARVLNTANDLENAKTVIEYALSLDPENLTAKTEMAKLMIKEGDLDGAKAHLEAAQELSPKSLERLCKLGEVEMQSLQVEEATEKFSAALDIDAEDQEASDGKTLCENLGSYFRGADVTSIPETFASLLNVVGISMVKRGDREDGISHYKAAMTYVYNNIEKGKLAFNIGLGFERGSDNPSASEWFKKCLELWPESEKAAAHLKTVSGEAPQEAPPADDETPASIVPETPDTEEDDDEAINEETIYDAAEEKKASNG